MSKHDPKVRLLHMRDYVRKSLEFAQVQCRNDLDIDEKFALALTHLVELVGEAASQFPRELQKDYPKIPFKKIIAMRHRLIHGYYQVNYDILWDTVTQDFPELLKELESAIS
jgi:uncharacterized protein with HEPN domain